MELRREIECEKDSETQRMNDEEWLEIRKETMDEIRLKGLVCGEEKSSHIQSLIWPLRSSYTLDAAAKKLGMAMSEVGFMYLVNIPGFKPDELYQGETFGSYRRLSG